MREERKTIKIPAGAYRRLREIAERRRMSISALIAELAASAREDAPPAAPEGFRVRAASRPA